MTFKMYFDLQLLRELYTFSISMDAIDGHFSTIFIGVKLKAPKSMLQCAKKIGMIIGHDSSTESIEQTEKIRFPV